MTKNSGNDSQIKDRMKKIDFSHRILTNNLRYVINIIAYYYLLIFFRDLAFNQSLIIKLKLNIVS